MRLLPRLRRNQATMPPATDKGGAQVAPEPRDLQCSTTRKGSRCKLPAAPGTDRCLVHAPTTPAAA